MTVTVQDFRANFPEFGSSAIFPNGQVQMWLTVAARFVNASRWGDSTDLGVQLYAAHNIVLSARAAKEAQNGGVPGQNTGPLNSKSVDKVSAGYDTGAASVEGAGNWNLTTYGTRFIQMAKLFGAGPMQIYTTVSGPNSGPAWPGPDVTPGITTFG